MELQIDDYVCDDHTKLCIDTIELQGWQAEFINKLLVDRLSQLRHRVARLRDNNDFSNINDLCNKINKAESEIENIKNIIKTLEEQKHE